MPHRHCSRMQEMSDSHSLPAERRHRRLHQARRPKPEATSRQSREWRNGQEVGGATEDSRNPGQLRRDFAPQRPTGLATDASIADRSGPHLPEDASSIACSGAPACLKLTAPLP